MALKSLNSIQKVLFRSPLVTTTYRFSSSIKMASIEELKLKSKQANGLIESLRSQIEQIKLATSPAYVADKAKSLEKENTELRAQVEQLKKQLEEVEAAKGPSTFKATTVQPTESQVVSTPVSSTDKKTEKAEKTEKTEKKPKQAAQPKKEEIAPEDINFSKLDVRVGKITKCEKHPDADALYVEQIDLGEGKERTVCSGLVRFIPLEQMQNRLVIVLCNLKPNKLRGVMSEAMVLCASTPEKVELMVPPANAAIGDRVIVEEFKGEPATELNQKNNIFGIVAVDMKTNDDLVGTYKGFQMVIAGKGPIKSETLKNVPIK